MSVQRRVRRGIAAAAALLIAACSVNPTTGENQFTGLMPAAQEAAIGRAEHPKILAGFGGSYDDPDVAAFVGGLGQRITAASGRDDVTWTFTVLDTEVVNAFALPGGYVYVTRGLLALAEDEAEVAGVLAHEIGHVLARHSAQRMSRATVAGVLAAGLGMVLGSPQIGEVLNAGSGLLLADYSRDQELEADALGVDLLARAGYDPFAMATFLETMRRKAQYDALRTGKETGGDNFFSTHPRTGERVAQAAARARAIPAQGWYRGEDAYNRAVAGMIYGDSPAHGFVRGTVFAHPGMGFRFEVPQGFSLINGADRVVARGPDGAAILFDAAPAPRGMEMTAYLAQRWARGIPLGRLQALEISGLPAATALAVVPTRSGRVTARLVAIRMGARIFHFAMLAPGRGAGSHDAAFRRVAASFRPLTGTEAAAYRPLRVRIHTVRPGDTVGSLAARMPAEPHAEELFRILNDLPPGAPLPVGSAVKIIAE